MRHITDAEVNAAVQLIEKCQDVHELDATMRDIMKAIPINEAQPEANSIRSLPLERIAKIASAMIAQIEAFQAKEKGRLQ
jgi:hypothetical protein